MEARPAIPSVSLYSFVGNLNGATTESGSGSGLLILFLLLRRRRRRSESVYGPRERGRRISRPGEGGGMARTRLSSSLDLISRSRAACLIKDRYLPILLHPLPTRLLLVLLLVVVAALPSPSPRHSRLLNSLISRIWTGRSCATLSDPVDLPVSLPFGPSSLRVAFRFSRVCRAGRIDAFEISRRMTAATHRTRCVDFAHVLRTEAMRFSEKKEEEELRDCQVTVIASWSDQNRP